MDVEDMDSEERDEEVFLEEEEESIGIHLAEIVVNKPHILKSTEKATTGVDQNMFPNARNMVNTNFLRPNQPRPRLDLGASGKTTTETRAMKTKVDPKAKGKAKMHLEVT
ncbi:hypothetical protein L3X38_042664 [Prunus dulcis]|uniref:Uncharacterized protein n=1 Tax=Prunus dulcis TaxID=3755 RepID=A0AAD4UVL8_PRUDU|nr:hypothetical protein L3X38_042664 [Prunus dulcis]